MKLPYIAPLAELICFRPVEDLMTQDEFKDTMDLFGDFSPDSSATSLGEDVEGDFWG